VNRQATDRFTTTLEALCLYLAPELSAIVLPSLPALTEIRLVRGYQHRPWGSSSALGKGARLQPARDCLPSQARAGGDRGWSEALRCQRQHLLILREPSLSGMGLLAS
jgi:hypothetical protein